MNATLPERQPAGLARVLAASVYDGLLTLAVLFLAGALALLVTGGEAVTPGDPAFRLWLLAAGFPYFGWCWTRGGQTLGMRAWKLVLEGDGGAPVTLGAAALRYLGAVLSWAALGLGFLWLLVPPSRRSWHDRISGTRVLRAEPPAKTR